MLITRVIPALLVRNKGLVKGVRFKDHRYIGDIMNAIRIFNTKEVDELMLLDIEATSKKSMISPELIVQISSECLMPITVGGGIVSVDGAKTLFSAGAEKVLLGTGAIETPNLVSEIASKFGCQSVVVSIDVKKNWLGRYEVYSHCGCHRTGHDPVSYAKSVEERGGGEILLNSIDRDGTLEGFDTALLREVSDAVNIPVIALGGAGKLNDLKLAVDEGHATAVACGSYFVFHGRRQAVLISFPTRQELEMCFPTRQAS